MKEAIQYIDQLNHMGMVIEPMNIDFLPRIYKLENPFSPQTPIVPYVHFLQRKVADSQGVLHTPTLQVTGLPVAFSCVGIYGAGQQVRADLGLIHTARILRGQGVASLLHHLSLDYLLQHDITELFVQVANTHPRVAHMLEFLGLSVSGQVFGENLYSRTLIPSEKEDLYHTNKALLQQSVDAIVSNSTQIKRKVTDFQDYLSDHGITV